MPDMFVHVLIPWIGYRSFQLVSGNGSSKDMTVLLLGSILPDIYGLAYVLEIFGVSAHAFMLPFHTLLGSALVAALLSLMFSEKIRSFLLLEFGTFVHFGLDSLLLHVAGGMVLLFPFSWIHGYQFGVFPTDSWIPPAATAACALFLLLLSRRVSGRRLR